MISTIRHFRKKTVLGLISFGYSIPAPFLEKYRELVYLRQFLLESEINCVLDVGANVGQFAEDLRGIGYTGQIVSFEPVESEFKQLTHRFKNDKNWSGYKIALGSSDGTEIINVPNDTSMASILDFHSSGDVSRKEEIQIDRLDNFLAKKDIDLTKYRTLLKMDTQGFDLEVFKGASQCLAGIMGLMSEISVIPIYEEMVNYRDALAIYEAAGFKLINLSTVSKNKSSNVVELNCLMSR